MAEDTGSESHRGEGEGSARAPDAGEDDGRAEHGSGWGRRFEVQVAHPYVADDHYRQFADDLDWGIA